MFSLIINDADWVNTNFINSGGAAITYGSMLAQEDKYYEGGQTATRSSDYIIEGTEDGSLYRSVRF